MTELQRLVKRGTHALRHDGVGDTMRRLARFTGTRFGGETPFPLEDGLVADSLTLTPMEPGAPPSRNRPLRIGWVCTPPAQGSGGHTTMFRMIEALEQRGHSCLLYLYDRFQGDFARHEAIVRRGWPNVKAEIRDARTGLGGADVLVATSWESAHVIASVADTTSRRMYFVQDFEPYFYPRGAHFELALDTYRFGFRIISLGAMVARCLRDEVGVDSDVVHFGCDTDVYRLLPDTRERNGVVCYVRPTNQRRGYWMARMALAEFARRHPTTPISLYGARVTDLPFEAQVFPHLDPDELNALYNRCAVGLSLSFTNISLVPEELLRAGVVPVVNDWDPSHEVLTNPHVVWAPSTPSGLADALSRVVTSPKSSRDPQILSGSVESSWERTQAELVAVVECEAYREDLVLQQGRA